MLPATAAEEAAEKVALRCDSGLPKRDKSSAGRPGKLVLRV